MSEDLILGVDGGGTKVLLALADCDGHILRVARGGGVNPMDNPGWHQELQAQFGSFANQKRLGAIVAALPAFGESRSLSEAEREAVVDAFGSLPKVLLNDVDAAHIGAFAGGPGVLLLSGTGSMAWRRDAESRSSRVGGWGDVIGDEGSAYWIGCRALNLVSQSLDGRAPKTGLVEAVFSKHGLDLDDAMSALQDWVTGLALPRAEIASLSVLVDEQARAGDAGARTLIEQAADELIRHFTAIVPAREDRPAWSFAGGTFASRVLLDAVTVRIGYPPVPPRLPPVGGALLAAANELGWPVPTSFIDRIAAELAPACTPDVAREASRQSAGF